MVITKVNANFYLRFFLKSWKVDISVKDVKMYVFILINISIKLKNEKCMKFQYSRQRRKCVSRWKASNLLTRIIKFVFIFKQFFNVAVSAISYGQK